jgi:hypothetical protein
MKTYIIITQLGKLIKVEAGSVSQAAWRAADHITSPDFAIACFQAP